MKKAGIIATAILCIALLLGGFWIVKEKTAQEQNKEQILTEVQRIITKDLSANYPKTPREVIKLYNRIITCYYKEEFSQEELEQLADQALLLMDAELAAANPKANYLMAVKSEIRDYKNRDRYIAQSDVCESDAVIYKTIDEDEIAYVDASYFVREGTGYGKTYQRYVLRKDTQGQWKILVFYQISAPAEEE